MGWKSILIAVVLAALSGISGFADGAAENAAAQPTVISGDNGSSQHNQTTAPGIAPGENSSAAARRNHVAATADTSPSPDSQQRPLLTILAELAAIISGLFILWKVVAAVVRWCGRWWKQRKFAALPGMSNEQVGRLYAKLALGELNNLLDNAKTPLLLAAQRGTPEAVKQLIAAGADVTAKDNTGKTALDYARENDRAEEAELLREAMAKVQKAPSAAKP